MYGRMGTNLKQHIVRNAEARFSEPPAGQTFGKEGKSDPLTRMPHEIQGPACGPALDSDTWARRCYERSYQKRAPVIKSGR